ncbi:hypothetical protein K402DRAFT_145317 [Aulographum hederae CBS 113979]|uniref:Uncharacterized protein n=1 Tax=Aulographum hederae CBS 113979 TaxID=1176131 RepID=A0A6G1GU51_9PEZI|nr:hypothetical protein K402DRAFT_145317 [Aulographum hederae CBS 113979]
MELERARGLNLRGGFISRISWYIGVLILSHTFTSSCSKHAKKLHCIAFGPLYPSLFISWSGRWVGVKLKDCALFDSSSHLRQDRRCRDFSLACTACKVELFLCHPLATAQDHTSLVPQ